MSSPLLFSEFKLRSITLRNRIVVSPMCQYSARDGMADDWHLVNAGKLAQGGAGLVFLEATAVEARGRITHGDLGLWHDGQIPGLRRIADFIRSQRAVPAIQLGHAGRKGGMQRPWFGNGPLTQADFDRGDHPWPTVAASGVPVDSHWQVPAALTAVDLQQVREAFRAAARRADAAGFDAVEVHGAHGYLLHTFLSPLANRRNDAYGGDLEGRMKFPLEVAAAVREAWPQDKPVFFRCSAVDDYDGGWSLADSVTLARRLAALGVDVVDCSSAGIYDSATGAAKTMPRTPRVPGFQVPYAERIRSEAGIATMAVGLILDAPQAETILQQQRADLIAVGREVLYDPNWPLHAAQQLGVDADFDMWPVQYGWWLTRREAMLAKQGLVRRPSLEVAGD